MLGAHSPRDSEARVAQRRSAESRFQSRGIQDEVLIQRQRLGAQWLRLNLHLGLSLKSRLGSLSTQVAARFPRD